MTGRYVHTQKTHRQIINGRSYVDTQTDAGLLAR